MEIYPSCILYWDKKKLLFEPKTHTSYFLSETEEKNPQKLLFSFYLPKLQQATLIVFCI